MVSNGNRRRTSGRVPPHDLGAEASVLGAMLLHPRAMDDPRVLRLTPADFYRPDHGHVFSSMRALIGRGVPVDAITVAHDLRTVGVIENVEVLVMELQAAPPATVNAGRYAAIVADCAYRRRAISLAGDITAVAHDSTDTVTVARTVRDGLALLESVGIDDEGAVDVTEVVDLLMSGGDPGPWPTMLTRADGRPLIYLGALVLVYGLGGSGKSILASHLTAERIAAGEHVVWLDYEQTPGYVIGWLLRVGADPDAVKQYFHYRSAIGHPIGTYVPTVRRLGASLVVIDAVIGALGVEGIEENENSAVGKWMDTQLRPITRDRLGQPTTTALALDHVAAEQPGARRRPNQKARGATRKHDAADLAIEAHVLSPFSRDRRGTLGLTVWKDRFGSFARGERVAEVDVHPLDHGASVSLAVNTPAGRTESGTFRPTKLMERISCYVELHPGASYREIDDNRNVPGDRTYKREALAVLIEEGFVEVEKDGQTTHHYVAQPFREATDPGSTT